MPSPDLLESAGQRAAFRPVPAPPSLHDLTAEVGRRRTKKRRTIGGGLVALALVVGLPVGASFIGSDEPDVVTFAADDVDSASVSEGVVALQPAETSSTSTSTSSTSSTSTSVPEDSSSDADLGPLAGMDEDNFTLTVKSSEMSISVEVITGGDAAERANAAEAAADSTQTIDDVTVWRSNEGDQTTASAFLDGETFISVTGPTNEIDEVLDLVTGYSENSMNLFDGEFELDGEFEFDDDFRFDFDGDGLPEDLDEFFDDLKFPGVDQEVMDEFRQQMKEFSECMQPTFERSGDSATIEIPDCDPPGFEGLIAPGLSEFFDGEDFDIEYFGDLFKDRDLHDITKDLDDLLDDVFDDADDALKAAEDALKDAQDALEDAE